MIPSNTPYSYEDHTSKQEAGVWVNLKAGDHKALRFLYTKYFNSLYNYGSKITSDSGLAEDCIQDLFIELWNKRESLSEVKNVKYYLYKSLRRKIIYKISILSRLPQTDELTRFETELSHKSHYLSQQINNEMREKIMRMLETLSPKQREAIFLLYYEGLSYEEVANIMSLKVKTVYNLVYQAISKLRENKSGLSLHLFG